MTPTPKRQLLHRSVLFASVLFAAMLLLASAFCFPESTFAQDTAVGTSGMPAQPTPYQFILGSVNFFLLAFFVYYVFVLRPTQLKQDEHARFLKDLKAGDEVIAGAGMFGKVTAIQPEFITVEIAANTRIRVQSDHVASAVPKPVGGKAAPKAEVLDKNGKVVKAVERSDKSGKDRKVK